MKRSIKRTIITSIIYLLSLPAFFLFILTIPFLTELAVVFIKDSPILSFMFFLLIGCGISAGVFLFYVTKQWIKDHKLGKTKPMIATVFALGYLVFICTGKIENIYYIVLICSPSIIFACYLVYWHSNPHHEKHTNNKKAPI